MIKIDKKKAEKLTKELNISPGSAGAKAAENHVKQYENPYPKGTRAHTDWDYGWAEQTWGGIEY